MAPESATSYWTAITSAAGTEDWRCQGENMGLGYDIFRESSDGSPLWVAQAATLKEAEDKADTLAGTVPAAYFIRDAASAKIVGRSCAKNSEEIRP